MHFNRFAAFLAGAWLLGSLFMAFVATQNFATVDRVLGAPPPETVKMIQTLGPENARHLLRYLAGEENRGFFEAWELVEIILGVSLIALFFLGSKNRILAGLAGGLLVLTIFQHFRITPDLVAIGRSNEFLTGNTQGAVRSQFARLHAIYGIVELVKIALTLVIAGFLFARRRRSSRQRVEVDAVNYANHGHVDR